MSLPARPIVERHTHSHQHMRALSTLGRSHLCPASRHHGTMGTRNASPLLCRVQCWLHGLTGLAQSLSVQASAASYCRYIQCLTCWHCAVLPPPAFRSAERTQRTVTLCRRCFDGVAVIISGYVYIVQRVYPQSGCHAHDLRCAALRIQCGIQCVESGKALAARGSNSPFVSKLPYPAIKNIWEPIGTVCTPLRQGL